MAERREKRRRFSKGNIPWNKRLDSNQSGIMFTRKFCGKRKPIEELEVLTGFPPPLPACRDCWKSLKSQEFKRGWALSGEIRVLQDVLTLFLPSSLNYLHPLP